MIPPGRLDSVRALKEEYGVGSLQAWNVLDSIQKYKELHEAAQAHALLSDTPYPLTWRETAHLTLYYTKLVEGYLSAVSFSKGDKGTPKKHMIRSYSSHTISDAIREGELAANTSMGLTTQIWEMNPLPFIIEYAAAFTSAQEEGRTRNVSDIARDAFLSVLNSSSHVLTNTGKMYSLLGVDSEDRLLISPPIEKKGRGDWDSAREATDELAGHLTNEFYHWMHEDEVDATNNFRYKPGHHLEEEVFYLFGGGGPLEGNMSPYRRAENDRTLHHISTERQIAMIGISRILGTHPNTEPEQIIDFRLAELEQKIQREDRRLRNIASPESLPPAITRPRAEYTYEYLALKKNRTWLERILRN